MSWEMHCFIWQTECRGGEHFHCCGSMRWWVAMSALLQKPGVVAGLRPERL